MQGFIGFLFLQACLCCTSILLLVQFSEAVTFFCGAAWPLPVFLATCLLLRVLLHQPPLCLGGGLLLYTGGLVLLSCQASACLLSMQGEEGLLRGRWAVYMGCFTLLLGFVIVQIQMQQMATVQDVILHSVSIVLFLSGVTLVAIDDRVWDMRYAYAILFAIVSSTYLNSLSFLFISAKMGHSWLQACSLILLRPLLFAEDWLCSCLLS